jgi:hypothetical protein
VAILAFLALVVSSASADNPTTKFLTVTCDLNGQTTFSGWRGDPTDAIIIWADAAGTFAMADFLGDVPAHPRSVTVDTPTVLSDNGQPIAQVQAGLDYGTGTFPVFVGATCF